jgi:CheY-like chemotaxis protein
MADMVTSDDGERRVLIVDDDQTVRALLHILLELEGFVIVGEATNGVEAISLAAESTPAFVVLDYSMPLLNGDLTAMAMKVHTPGVRIVAFSSGLEETPPWADAFVPKESIKEVGPLLRKMIGVPAKPLIAIDQEPGAE